MLYRIIGLVVFWMVSVYFSFDYGVKMERVKVNIASNQALHEQKEKMQKEYTEKIQKLQDSNDKLNKLYNDIRAKGMCFDNEAIKEFNNLVE